MRAATFWNPSWDYAAGNMISTAGDLLVWGRAFAEGSLLSPRMRVQQRSFVQVQAGEDAFEGLGMDKWGELIGHSGMDPGYSSDMHYIPYADALVVVVTNLWSGPVPGRQILMDVARETAPRGCPRSAVALTVSGGTATSQVSPSWLPVERPPAASSGSDA